MTPRVFDDADVRRRLDAGTAVQAVREALLARHEGRLAAPPRVRAELGDGALVFTAGRLDGPHSPGVFGFRAYATHTDAGQLVAVWEENGALAALVHGDELGPRRTGAIGAVAVDALARPGPARLGLVGAGTQAWTQLWATCAVREVTDVAVASRRRERAEALARRARTELGVAAHATGTAEDAVRDRDVVILATNSTEPVVETHWLAPGTHLNTLGPKTVSRHEVPASLADRAGCVVTDSPAQVAASPEPPVLPAGRMTGLGAVLAGAAEGRGAPDEVTVFWSVGLAGTEVALAAALL